MLPPLGLTVPTRLLAHGVNCLCWLGFFTRLQTLFSYAGGTAFAVLRILKPCKPLVTAIETFCVRWCEPAFILTSALGAWKVGPDSSALITGSRSVVPALFAAWAHMCQPIHEVTAESVMYG